MKLTNQDRVNHHRYSVIEQWVFITDPKIVRTVFDLQCDEHSIEHYKMAVMTAICHGNESMELLFPEFAHANPLQYVEVNDAEN